MLKSLRYRLLTWFALSTILIGILAFSLFQLHSSNKEKNQAILDRYHFFRYQFLKDQNLTSAFLSTDIYQPEFYLKGESKSLNEHYGHISKIDSCFINFSSKKVQLDNPLGETLFSLRGCYTNYCILFDSLVYNLYRRGYGDYGLEGKLNQHYTGIVQTKLVGVTTLANLKINNTDYNHHPNNESVTMVNSLLDEIQDAGKNHSNILQEEARAYQNTFNQIVALNKKLGFQDNIGLRQELIETGQVMENLINSSIEESKRFYQARMARFNQLFVLTVFLIIAISFTLSVYTSRYLVKHLENLTRYISSLAKSNFNKKLQIDFKHSTIEIKKIYAEFESMLKELGLREEQRDIALKNAEENQQRYRDLADLLPQAIYETDKLGNLTYVNKSWYKAFGFTKHDFEEGINLIEILNTNHSSVLLEATKTGSNEMLAIKSDGTKYPVTVYSDVIKKGLRVIGRRGIIIDDSLKHRYIESLKTEAERAITSDKLKSSFLANMSHEIRTPMNSIIGFSNMLSSNEIPQEVKEDFIGHIQSSSEMLLNLVDDIIDVAKIEAGQLKIQKGGCRPKHLVTELAQTFEAYKQRIEKSHIQLNVSVPDTEMPFKTDDFRLKQILTNLISNAIKFTESGHVEIGLWMKTPQLLEFWVEDTGIGMNADELRTIFERFKRTKLSEKKKISGTGLGLAISKNLVEMLDGSMFVKSTPGVGTRFSFELPYLRIVDETLNKEDSPGVATSQYNWTGKKLLIAEDDQKGYAFLQHLLQKTGIEIIRAENGREAVEATRFHNNIDLILMDIQMPELNGLQATSIIKEKLPRLPVIAQTAYAMDEDRNKCTKAGCDDYITKPINAEKLLAKLAQFLKPKAPEEPCQTETEETRKNVHYSSKNK